MERGWGWSSPIEDSAPGDPMELLLAPKHSQAGPPLAAPAVGAQRYLGWGHQPGKGPGAPFPASAAAVPASFASDPPNYS